MIPYAVVQRINDTWCEVDVRYELQGLDATSHVSIDERDGGPHVELHETFFGSTEIMTEPDEELTRWLCKFALDAWIDSECVEKGVTLNDWSP